MKIKQLLVPLLALLTLASCRSSKEEIAYIHDAPRDSAMAIQGQYHKCIQTNDLLSIYVESEEPSSTVRFNQETNKIAVADGTVLNPNTSAVKGYLVNDEGDIIFPVLGKLHVEGLTHNQLAASIEQTLVEQGHIKDPRVTVKLMNFKVSILGDVAKPGELHVEGERLTVFEAIAMAGDLNISGQRYNITVVREENGQRTVGEIDLSSKEVFNSPYYYLHQNDVVYVEPNMKKKRAANRDPFVLSTVTTCLSIVSTLATSLYYFAMINRYSH